MCAHLEGHGCHWSEYIRGIVTEGNIQEEYQVVCAHIKDKLLNLCCVSSQASSNSSLFAIVLVGRTVKFGRKFQSAMTQLNLVPSGANSSFFGTSSVFSRGNRSV